jgi:hypothetical protein
MNSARPLLQLWCNLRSRNGLSGFRQSRIAGTVYARQKFASLVTMKPAAECMKELRTRPSNMASSDRGPEIAGLQLNEALGQYGDQ